MSVTGVARRRGSLGPRRAARLRAAGDRRRLRRLRLRPPREPLRHAGSVYAFIGLSARAARRASSAAGRCSAPTSSSRPCRSSAIAVFGAGVPAQHRHRHDAAVAAVRARGLGADRACSRRATSRRPRARCSRSSSCRSLLILALMAVDRRQARGRRRAAGLGLTGDFVDLPDGVGLSTVVLPRASASSPSPASSRRARSARRPKRPTHTIPRSMIVAIAFGGVFYVICVVAQTLGFGTDAAGRRGVRRRPPRRSATSPTPTSAPRWRTSLDLVAIVSSIGAGLGCALGRRADVLRLRPRRRCLRQELSRRVGGRPARPVDRPRRSCSRSRCSRLVASRSPARSRSTSFFYLATMGILSLLVMYVLTNVGALRYLFAPAGRAAPLWEIVLPRRRDRVRASTSLYQQRLAGARPPVQRLPVRRRRLARDRRRLVARAPGRACNAPPGRGTVVHVDRHRRRAACVRAPARRRPRAEPPARRRPTAAP